jgi:hypothetical protein
VRDFFYFDFRYLFMDLPGILSFRAERLRFRATDLDLGLALIATFLLPVA